MRYLWALTLILAQSASAARVIGFASASISFIDSPNVSLTAQTGAATQTSPGSPTGPNFVQTALSASGTALHVLTANGVRGTAEMDLTAGPGSSFTNAIAEGVSGVVRLTNSGASPVNVFFDYWLVIDASANGPGTATLEVQTPVERFNFATQSWEVLTTSSFNLNTGESNQLCASICKSLPFVTLDANSFADLRVRSYLRGSGSQAAAGGPSPPPPAAVPEPASFLLTASAVAALAAGPFRKRRTGADPPANG